MTAHCRRFLLLKHKEDKTHKKQPKKKKTKRREGAYLQAPALPFHFWFLLLSICFKRFLLASSSSQVKEKKRKTMEKKRNAMKGKNFPSSSRSALSFLAPAFTHLFQTLSFGIFFFSNRIKEKENHGEKKNCRKRKEFSFKLLLYPLTFGSRFCPPTSGLLFQTLFPNIFFFSNKRKKKKP